LSRSTSVSPARRRASSVMRSTRDHRLDDGEYGYIVHKVEDLYVKFKRPYSIS
jgi:hypothetical protein